MLCRVLQARLPRSVETVYLANPSVSPEEILHAIAFRAAAAYRPRRGRLVVMHALNEYLLRRHAEGRQWWCSSKNRRACRSRPGRDPAAVQPRDQTAQTAADRSVRSAELDDNLRKPEIRQLRERITHSFSLSPLMQKSPGLYCVSLRAAGYHGPDLFNDARHSLSHSCHGGLTRRINIVCG
jgi:type II secretory pathway predicted ATPase ExeA